MIGWYQLFFFSVLGLWLFASPRDRIALRIVLGATIAAELLKYGVTVHITGAWKLVIPATLETATIIALLYWARNRTGYMQAGCLVIAWLAHVLCYADVVTGTNVVYDRYESLLLLVAVAQLAACHDTIIHNLRRMGHWLDALRPRSPGAFRSASVRSALLPDPRSPRS